MSKSNATETALLDYIFTNVAPAWDAATQLDIHLHTADPGEAGSQTTNETTYTSYARVAVARSGAGWTVTGNSVSPAATISFPACTGGTATITHVGIGTDSSGAGVLLYKGALTPNIAVSSGVTPQVTTASTVTED